MIGKERGDEMTDGQNATHQATGIDWQEREYSACLEVSAKMFELLIASAKISLVFNGSLFAAAAIIIERSGIAEMVKSGGSANYFLTASALAISILGVVFNVGSLVAVRNYDVLLKEIAKRFSEMEVEIFGPEVVEANAPGKTLKSSHIGRILHSNQSETQRGRAADWTNRFYVALIAFWGLLGTSVNILPLFHW